MLHLRGFEHRPQQRESHEQRQDANHATPNRHYGDAADGAITYAESREAAANPVRRLQDGERFIGADTLRGWWE